MKNQTVSSEKEILILLQSGKPREEEEAKEQKGGGQKGQQPLGEVRFSPSGAQCHHSASKYFANQHSSFLREQTNT